MSLFSLKNKNIIITGASNGNGNKIAKELYKYGANVINIDYYIPSVKDNVDYFHCDICDHEKLNSVIQLIIDKYKNIDVLINNAGISISNPSEDYKLEDWIQTLNVNLTSPFYLSQLIGNHMISNNIQGSIINITSLGAKFGFPENPAYQTSKGGLQQLTKALAYDWGKYGIRVNNLAPGYIRTRMTEKSWNNEKLKKEREDRTILGRWGNSEDLVGAIIFLASDASKYITGQDIFVDGGWSAKGL